MENHPDDLVSRQFCALADKELASVLSLLPSDPDHRNAILVETTRLIDYWSVFQGLLPKEQRLADPDFDILQWGWNLAAANLFSHPSVAGAFPIMESTADTRNYAGTLLHQLGRIVLVRRSAQMIRVGFQAAEKTANGYVVRSCVDAKGQFQDLLESLRFEEAEQRMYTQESRWTATELDRPGEFDRVKNLPGNFLGRYSRLSELQKLVRSNIETLMLPLVRPWDSGHGVMVGYDAIPEVDGHFLATATEQALDWREDAGIHPTTDLGGISGADLTGVGAILIALHMKHVRFVLLAAKRFTEVSLPQSLTIWGPKKELEESISDFTGIDHARVQRVIDAVALHPSDVQKLHGHTTPFRPLLMDMGNGVLVRPVSSIVKNPFYTARTLLEWRDKRAVLQIAAPREGWMRNDLYALFQGNKYSCVEGSIKIRKQGVVLTDIDAAVLDRTTGELGLFQIKWQDFSTNDVRQLRSKASNLAREMDDWADKIESWLSDLNPSELPKALRLKVPKGAIIHAIHLFGISRSVSRLQGYGYAHRNRLLCLANWHQFVRVRFEVGPVERVFLKIAEAINEEEAASVQVKPLAVTISVAGTELRFEDQWNQIKSIGTWSVPPE